MKRIHLFIGVIILSVVLYSCGSGAPEKENNNQEIDKKEDVQTEPTSPVNGISYTLPSPLQVALMFKSSGMKFQGGLTKDVSKAENLPDNFHKKMNLGVYTADFAYCALNNQNQEAMEILSALRLLSQGIGYQNIYDSEAMLKRFESNLGSEDSITVILTDIQIRADQYQQQNGIEDDGFVIFAGAWVETMHIALNSLKADPENKNLFARLSEQHLVMEGLIGGLEQVKSNDPDFPKLVASLKKIRVHFNRLENEEEESGTLNDSELKGLTADIDDIRNTLING